MQGLRINVDDKKNLKEIVDQIHFDGIGLGFNHSELILEMLKEVFHFEETETLTLGGVEC